MTAAAPPPCERLTRASALLSGRTGRGVAIAVVDSGVNPDHPHVIRAAEGLAIASDGSEGADWLDRLGHGTAVTAAIQEKAPEATVLTIRVFHDTLATTAGALVRAIDAAAERGARLINLSLGTAELAHAAPLAGAVERALARGALVVSAREHRGRRWWPGCLSPVAGVLLDWQVGRDEVRLARSAAGEPAFRASGYPRPIPGVPPERNLRGISFAVANATGLFALLLEGRPELASPEALATAIEAGGERRDPAGAG